MNNSSGHDSISISPTSNSKKLGLSLAETIAEGRLEADLEEALGGTAPVDLWPDIGDATTWAAAVRDVQDERRRQRMLLLAGVLVVGTEEKSPIVGQVIFPAAFPARPESRGECQQSGKLNRLPVFWVFPIAFDRNFRQVRQSVLNVALGSSTYG